MKVNFQASLCEKKIIIALKDELGCFVVISGQVVIVRFFFKVSFDVERRIYKIVERGCDLCFISTNKS